MKQTSNNLTRQALKMIDLKGFTCWRQNNSAVWDPTKKVFRAGSSTPGVPDIIGYHRRTGRFLAAEIKVGRDRLRPEQIDFLKGVEQAGGVAIVIRTTDDLVGLDF